MTDKKSIFDDLNAQIKAAAGELPDTLTVGGVTYRRGAQAGARTRKGDYRNPRTHQIEKDVELESITINLAPHSDRITYNGTHYLQGHTYDVPVDLAATFKDMMQRTWQHEHQTGGANSFGAGAVRNPAYQSAGVGYAR